MEWTSKYSDQAITLGMTHGPKIVLALATLIVGWLVIGVIGRVFRRVLTKHKVDDTLRPFLVSLLSNLLKVMLVVSAASMVGIETTSFVAVLGAAGLAVGLALQGSLANFAGGVLILIFRPYRVGDLIEAQGVLGVVQSVQIFTTTLLNPQNKTIIVPNGPLANGNITNYAKAGTIRVDASIGIGYGENIAKARDLLMEVMQKDPNVLAEPAPLVAVAELGDSSVNLAVRPWCKPEHYWDVFFGTLENGKIALDAAGIEIPFPQRVVHMKND